MYCPQGSFPEDWDIEGLSEYYNKIFLPKDIKLFKDVDPEDLVHNTAIESIKSLAYKAL